MTIAAFSYGNSAFQDKLKHNLGAYLTNVVLALPLILGSLLMFLPLIWAVSFSFGQPHEFFKLPPPVIPSAMRLDNYQGVFERVDFLRFFLNSVFVTGCVTIAQLITCSMGGYAFARLRFPGKRIIFILFLASMMVPQHVTLIPVFIIIRGMGLYNNLGALIVPYATSVFGTFLLKQFFETIPDELEDAAKIDGAGFLQIYWRIMLPLAGPPLATLAILTFNSSWNNFFWPLIFINSAEKMTLPLGMIYLRGQDGVTNSGVLMAAIVLNLVPVLIFFMIFQRRLVEGVTLSGLKGA
ncbi:MAG: carbohydrate ABC transporter permease [Chloroflexota bacterium]|nr:carbohydrate ABC transporter permease [Chloroflexota bacterium]